MNAAKKLNLVSEDAYLMSEEASQQKHEYLGGVVYAMAGGRNVHHQIAGNVFGALWNRLRGTPCRPFNSDTKIRVQRPAHVRFYYPAASVICRPNPGSDSYQDEPRVIFEVLSKRTRRIDEGEKLDAYLGMPSVTLYVLVEQEVAALVAYRRTGLGFIREAHEGLDAALPLPEIGAILPFAEIYDGIQFMPEQDE